MIPSMYSLVNSKHLTFSNYRGVCASQQADVVVSISEHISRFENQALQAELDSLAHKSMRKMRDLCWVHEPSTRDTTLPWTVGEAADLLLRGQAGCLLPHHPAPLCRNGAKVECGNPRFDILRVVNQKKNRNRDRKREKKGSNK